MKSALSLFLTLLLLCGLPVNSWGQELDRASREKRDLLWETAGRLLNERIDFFEKRFGNDAWPVTDVRAELELLDRAQLSKNSHRLWETAAQRHNANAKRLYRYGYQSVTIAENEQELVAVYRLLLGESNGAYATCLKNLAFLYDLLGQYPRAEPIYQQASEIMKKNLGQEHPGYASSLGSLMMLMQHAIDLVEGFILLRSGHRCN